MAKDQYHLLLEDYLNDDLEASLRTVLEEALSEDEDLQTELKILQTERKAFQRLENYLDTEAPPDLKGRTWLASLYASVIMVGSFSSRATASQTREGKRKSDRGEWAVPGDSE
jgi:anti-sigma factor RsiW